MLYLRRRNHPADRRLTPAVESNCKDLARGRLKRELHRIRVGVGIGNSGAGAGAGAEAVIAAAGAGAGQLEPELALEPELELDTAPAQRITSWMGQT